MPRKKEPPADPARFDEAIEAFRKRVPMTRKQWDRLSTVQRERAFMVSEVTTADVLNDVWQGIDRAIEKGTKFEEFKATAGESLLDHWGGDKPGRLQTIFRTNVQTNYNAGRHAVISAPTVKRYRPYLRFDGIEDDAQTDICRALDGVVLEVDSDFWKTHTPPLHYQCRSVLTPLSDAEAGEEGIEDEPPDVEPQEGFGAIPSLAGADWEPDLKKYPAEIQAELRTRLRKR